MTLANDGNDAPSAAEIRAAVDRIAASPSFRRSPQLIAFLRFVAQSVLDGRAAYVKSYTIGVEAFGRDERFDPQADPIVRVEAARIRRALASYYDGEGAGEPIIVEMPLGGYVPVFRHRQNHRSLAILLATLRRTLRNARVPARATPSRLLAFFRRRRLRKRANGAGLRQSAQADTN